MKQVILFGLVALMTSMSHAAQGTLDISETVQEKASADICIQAAIVAVAKQAQRESLDLALTDVKSFKLIGVVSFQSSLSPSKTIVVPVKKTSAKKCIAGEVSVVENQDDVGIGGVTVHN